ncbi:MAG: hypothetical protein AABW45_01745 [Nanoarchaeota archaeon]
MYKKRIKIKEKKYLYYYHNFKVKGKVKNVFLSSNKNEAVEKLEKLLHRDLTEKEIKLINYGKTLLLILSLASIIGFLSYSGFEITGLVTLKNKLIDIYYLDYKFNIKEILGILISLQVLFFGYNIFKDYKNKRIELRW